MTTDITGIDATIRGAFSAGAVKDYRLGAKGGLQVDAEMFGSCENPIEIYRSGVEPPIGGFAEVRISVDRQRRAVAVKLRCRKCSSCLRARGNYWRKAAEREMWEANRVGARTWFGTLTLSPEEQAKATYAAISAVGAEQFSMLSELERLPLRHCAVSRSLTLALKRLRKELGAGSFRYLIVCEAHKSGLPHYHMLLHECSQGTPVRKALLNDFWRLGFSQWRLAKPEACRYVAKYLSKAALARVRASQRYGSKVHESALAVFWPEGPEIDATPFSGPGGPIDSGGAAFEREVYQHGQT